MENMIIETEEELINILQTKYNYTLEEAKIYIQEMKQ